MDLEQVIAAVSVTLQSQGDRPVSELEIELLRGAWDNLTYEDIAERSGYSLNYLQRDVGPRFWRLLGQLYGCRITKVNARLVLSQRAVAGVNAAAAGAAVAGTGATATGTDHSGERRSEPVQGLATAPALVGRQAEWAALQQWAEGLWGELPPTASRPVMLLTGEPGIGKTHLLEAFSATAQGHRARVLWGRGFAAEMIRPYGVWVDALRSLPLAELATVPTELGFLLPELGQPAQALPDPSRLFDAVVQLLAELARESPLLLVLDDLQWLDEASAALWHYAVRVLRPLPVGLIGAARDGELAANGAVSGVLRSLRREQRLHTLEVPPLEAAQVAELVAQAVPLQAGVPAQQVFADSGGNPLLALEIARSQGQPPTGTASTLEALIADRLALLDDPTQELLPWLAALGRTVQPTILAQVTDSPIGPLLTAIAQLEQQSILRPSSALSAPPQGATDGYDFAHGIMRQVVYQQIAAPRRQLIHRQIAQRLHHQAAQNETLASDIAYHAALGGEPALAVAAAAIAAEHSLKLFAYGEALHQARQGLAHCSQLGQPDRLLAQIRLLRVCALAGFSGASAAQLETDAQGLLQAAKGLGLAEAEAGALEILLILQFEGNNYRKVHQHSLQAAEVSRLVSPVTTARMLAYSGSCLAEIGRDMARAEALLVEAQSLASRAGIESCDIASGLGCVHRHHGRYEQARQHLRQAWQLAQAQRDHWREATCLSYLAMTEFEAGSPAAALPYSDEIAAVAAQMPEDSDTMATAQALTALVHYHHQTPAAAAALTSAIAALEQADSKHMLAYLLRQAALVDLACDRPVLALERSQRALEAAQIVNHPSETAHSWAVLVQSAIASHQPQRAVAALDLLHPHPDPYDLSLAAQAALAQALDGVRPYQSALSSHC